MLHSDRDSVTSPIATSSSGVSAGSGVVSGRSASARDSAGSGVSTSRSATGSVGVGQRDVDQFDQFRDGCALHGFGSPASNPSSGNSISSAV